MEKKDWRGDLLKIGEIPDGSEETMFVEFHLDTLNDFIKKVVDKAREEGGEITEDTSDGYHTFKELYEYRKLYNAGMFNLLPKNFNVHKSKRHSDGELCFGGGWFIVMATLPTGQISNHYELKDWDLFKCEERELADEWDGHTPEDVAKRIKDYLIEENFKEPTRLQMIWGLLKDMVRDFVSKLKDNK